MREKVLLITVGDGSSYVPVLFSDCRGGGSDFFIAESATTAPGKLFGQDWPKRMDDMIAVRRLGQSLGMGGARVGKMLPLLPQSWVSKQPLMRVATVQGPDGG